MNLDFLPKTIYDIITTFDLDKLYEIRLRKGFNVKICYGNQFLSKSLNIVVSDEDIKEILLNVTERSMYAFNEYIKNGFITTCEGIRIGIGGECVLENNIVITIKNVSSLNIRIPHKIKNCSNSFFDCIFDDELLNTLIISPPFLGKTTMLKDIAEKLNAFGQPILIVDERGEFCDVNGENIDKLEFSSKQFAFLSGIRALSPKVIITDELSNKDDWDCVMNAKNSGVKVLASCHAKNIEEVTRKQSFIKDIFDRYVVLKDDLCAGILEGVYDKDFNKL